MKESIWHRQSCNPGHNYLLARNIHKKFDNTATIVPNLKEGLKQFIFAEPAVRITIDTPKSNPERAILAIPFECNQDVIFENFAQQIYQNLMGYYLNADPQSSHFGLSNLVLEGNNTSLLRREMEKMLFSFQNRPDLAGRLLDRVKIIRHSSVPTPGPTYLSKTLKQGLDIHIGYRIVLLGEQVNCGRIFIPVQTETDIIDLIYFNIEKLLNQNFSVYDQVGNNALKITESLIFKELEGILRRSREKQNTRKKILNNLQFDIVFDKLTPQQDEVIKDELYDLLNHSDIEPVKTGAQQSLDLYSATLSQMGSSSAITPPPKQTDNYSMSTPRTTVPPPQNRIKVKPAPEEQREKTLSP